MYQLVVSCSPVAMTLGLKMSFTSHFLMGRKINGQLAFAHFKYLFIFELFITVPKIMNKGTSKQLVLYLGISFFIWNQII